MSDTYTTVTAQAFYRGLNPTHIEVTDPQAFGLWSNHVNVGQVLAVHAVHRPWSTVGSPELSVEHPRFLGDGHVSTSMPPHRVKLLYRLPDCAAPHPTAGSVVDRHGRPCPAADPDLYPLTGVCGCGDPAPVLCADGDADWTHDPRPAWSGPAHRTPTTKRP